MERGGGKNLAIDHLTVPGEAGHGVVIALPDMGPGHMAEAKDRKGRRTVGTGVFDGAGLGRNSAE
jgi:hypothetical protein